MDEGGTAVKNSGIRLLKSAQSFVRVGLNRFGGQRRGGQASGGLEGGGQSQRVGEAAVRVAGGGLPDHVVNGRGDVAAGGVDGGRRLMQAALHRGSGRKSGEGVATGEQFVQDDAQAVNVGLRRDGFVEKLLRRSIAGGDWQVRPGRFAAVLPGAGDAEIGQVSVAVFIQKDVGRFDIAMDDALPVGSGQGGGDLIDEGDGRCHPQRPFRQRILQTAAAQPAHDQKRAVRLAPVIIQRRDVGMFQPGD